jgi:mxaJ protein
MRSSGALVAFTAMAVLAIGDETPRSSGGPSGVQASESRSLRATLRVCADPNNLPFSNAKGEGFENKLAEIVARDIGRPLEYFWKPQRRGFIRTTLRAGVCDVVMGVPASFELARPTQPYYRSTYVFVTRSRSNVHVGSFDDPRLRQLRVGIQITGEDYDNPPPAVALASRQIVSNVRGYMVYGDYSRPDPHRTLIDGVTRGEIDVAIAWGPVAGFYAATEPVALDVTAVSPEIDLPFLPFVYDISMGVRRDDAALAATLDSVIDRRRADIDRLLAQYHVPVIAGPARSHERTTAAPRGQP